MGVWPGAPGANRYSPITPGYRHSYEHQQKMHQYPPQQVTSKYFYNLIVRIKTYIIV